MRLIIEVISIIQLQGKFCDDIPKKKFLYYPPVYKFADDSTFYCIHLLPQKIQNLAGVWSRFSAIYGKEGGGIED